MRKYLLPICFPVLYALIISFVFAFQVYAYDERALKRALAGSFLWGADLQDANLSKANLIYANLSDATMYGALLNNVNLSGANLTQVKNLSINKLYKVKTLYEAELDPVLMEQVKDKYPHLLRKPKK